jgi:hypothetical protein
MTVPTPAQPVAATSAWEDDDRYPAHTTASAAKPLTTAQAETATG